MSREQPNRRGPARAALRQGAGLVVIAVALGGWAGCSKDAGSDATAPTTTEPSTPSSSTTTSTSAPRTTTTLAGPTTTVDPAAPGPRNYAGAVDGQTGASVRFVLAGAVRQTRVEDLTIECLPLKGGGEPKTRKVDLTFPDAPLNGRTIEDTAGPGRLKPSLSGSFGVDGTFTGAVFLSGEDGGYVCGGEFTFTATAG